jgi:hypothetical protein
VCVCVCVRARACSGEGGIKSECQREHYVIEVRSPSVVEDGIRCVVIFKIRVESAERVRYRWAWKYGDERLSS